MLHVSEGLIENTDGLIRQYFPKDTNFNEVTDEEVTVCDGSFEFTAQSKKKFQIAE